VLCNLTVLEEKFNSLNDLLANIIKLEGCFFLPDKNITVGEEEPTSEEDDGVDITTVIRPGNIQAAS
jgi:hypothetical protein